MNYYRGFAPQNLATVSGQFNSSQEISAWYLLREWIAANEKAIPTDLKSISRWLSGLGIYRGQLKKCEHFLAQFLPKCFTLKDDGWHDEELDRQLNAYQTTTNLLKETQEKGREKQIKIRSEKNLSDDKTQRKLRENSENPLSSFDKNQGLSSGNIEGMNNSSLSEKNYLMTDNKKPEFQDVEPPPSGVVSTHQEEKLADTNIEVEVKEFQGIHFGHEEVVATPQVATPQKKPLTWVEQQTPEWIRDEEIEMLPIPDIQQIGQEKELKLRRLKVDYNTKFSMSAEKWCRDHEDEDTRYLIAHLRYAIATNKTLDKLKF